MNHLVLSVGGARGSFQAGAIAALPHKWDHIYGGSVGALNGAFLAVGGSPIEIWKNIKDKDVYRHKFGAARAGWSIALNKPMLDLDPLRDLMTVFLLGKLVTTPITVEVTGMDGSLNRYTKRKGERMDAEFIEHIYESAAIPFVFPSENGLDSGLQNPIPLSAAIDNASENDLICVISCHPIQRYAIRKPESEIDKLTFSLEVMQAALVRASIQPFLAINKLTDTGPWKRFQELVISPAQPLPWGMLDFSHSKTTPGLIAALNALK